MSNTATRQALNARKAYQNGNTPTVTTAPPNQARPTQERREHKPPQPPAVPALARRRPTGAVPWPFILIEGGEKTGKNWDMAMLSTSDRVGDCSWLDLSEGGADEYGAIPGADYWVVEHDGSWLSIMGQIRAIRHEAAEARERGDKPHCLFIDSGSLIWTGLSQWAEQLARRSPSGQRALRENPNAEVTITVTHWNAANKRWRDMMTLLLTFPGIVVMSARGKHVTEIDDKGKPVANSKVYKVEGQKDLAYDATVWVRKLRDGTTEIVGARSVHAGIRPGGDQPQEIRDGRFTLDWLIFDVLKCDPDKAHVRDLKDLDGDRGEAHEEIEQDKAAAAARVDPARRAVDYAAASSHGRLNGVPAAGPDANPGGEGEENARAEDDAIAFAQFCEDVVNNGINRPAIKALWDEARERGWLDAPMPGRDDTPRQVLTHAADQIKAAAVRETEPA